LRLGRLVLALSVVAAVVTAPVVTRTRLVCRVTGIEIAPDACPDTSASPTPELTGERCCEHRVQAPLSVAKSEPISQSDAVLTAVVVELPWFVQFTSSALPTRDASPPSRPPLSATRILLI
jgi:hypothetical protein